MREPRRIRIQKIRVKNFKSLVDFELLLSQFTCLIGLNGVGKSTVLQVMDFLAQLVRGDMKGWLEERQWESGDLSSKFNHKKKIEFRVWFQTDQDEPIGSWSGEYDPDADKCPWESIDFKDALLETKKNMAQFQSIPPDIQNSIHEFTGSWKNEIPFEYHGSILSVLKNFVLSPLINQCREFLRSTESLDMLTPERLRKRERTAGGTLGHGGKNLSAFIFELSRKERSELIKQLQKVYPKLVNIGAKSLPSGWKQLSVVEQFANKKITSQSKQVNDGLLRLMAILAEIETEHGLLLFDEIENGINPEWIEFVIDTLVNTKQQVLVTTHSPLILNYLDDTTAEKSVIYIYRTKEGYTKSLPFFSIPSMKKKLKVMGPGEVFVDTNLTKLATEITNSTME